MRRVGGGAKGEFLDESQCELSSVPSFARGAATLNGEFLDTSSYVLSTLSCHWPAARNRTLNPSGDICCRTPPNRRPARCSRHNSKL